MLALLHVTDFIKYDLFLEKDAQLEKTTLIYLPFRRGGNFPYKECTLAHPQDAAAIRRMKENVCHLKLLDDVGTKIGYATLYNLY